MIHLRNTAGEAAPDEPPPEGAPAHCAADLAPAIAPAQARDGSPSDGATGDRDAVGKKERVLHTRVPAVLEAELKRFAENLRIPVSNLVRTILEDALSVADAASETVEARLKNAAKQLEHERERLKKRVSPDPLREVFAYQPLTLGQAASCTKCRANLGPGERAHMGLIDGPPVRGRGRIFVCDSCLPKK